MYMQSMLDIALIFCEGNCFSSIRRVFSKIKQKMVLFSLRWVWNEIFVKWFSCYLLAMFNKQLCKCLSNVFAFFFFENFSQKTTVMENTEGVKRRRHCCKATQTHKESGFHIQGGYKYPTSSESSPCVCWPSKDDSGSHEILLARHDSTYEHQGQ